VLDRDAVCREGRRRRSRAVRERRGVQLVGTQMASKRSLPRGAGGRADRRRVSGLSDFRAVERRTASQLARRVAIDRARSRSRRYPDHYAIRALTRDEEPVEEAPFPAALQYPPPRMRSSCCTIVGAERAEKVGKTPRARHPNRARELGPAPARPRLRGSGDSSYCCADPRHGSARVLSRPPERLPSGLVVTRSLPSLTRFTRQGPSQSSV
jgi:hypothetical protein